MAKPFQVKEPEKQVIEKQINKEIKDKPEIKEKHEKNEAKDNSDAKVHKDQKDTKDAKEQKEQKEQKEHKEQKEKQEKDGKNEHKEKLEKEKHEKETKEHHKEHLPKEHLSKETVKEQLLEKLPEAQQTAQTDPEAIAALAQKSLASETVTTKLVEHKVHKDKIEIVEKFHKHEKIEFKEIEKFFEGPIDPGGPVEARLAALEAGMAQLMHFIPANLRPDLSQGALKQETDVPAAPPAEEPAGDAAKKEDKKK